MTKNELVAEFAQVLDDPVQESWIRGYLDGEQEAEDLVEAVLGTLEENYETDEDRNRRLSRLQRRSVD